MCQFMCLRTNLTDATAWGFRPCWTTPRRCGEDDERDRWRLARGAKANTHKTPTISDRFDKEVLLLELQHATSQYFIRNLTRSTIKLPYSLTQAWNSENTSECIPCKKLSLTSGLRNLETSFPVSHTVWHLRYNLQSDLHDLLCLSQSFLGSRQMLDICAHSGFRARCRRLKTV